MNDQSTSIWQTIDIAHTYWSYLGWQKHDELLAKSRRHAAAMMGEIEADADDSGDHNPLFTATWTAFGVVMTELVTAAQSRRQNPPGIKLQFAGHIVVQTLAALARDEQGLKNLIGYRKTGYLGHGASASETEVIACRDYIPKLIRYMDEIDAGVVTWRLDATIPVPQPEIEHQA